MRRLTLLFLLTAFVAVSGGAAQAAIQNGGAQPRQGGCTNDRDCDQFPDSSDACPDEYGYGTSNGCPDRDTDADYVPDSRDACPTVAAPNSQDGCPDGDGDGVADANDACPKAPGPAATQGCGDSDRDGLLDNKDACPQEGKDRRYPDRHAGPNGCYPTFVQVGYFASSLKYMADDVGGVIAADCDFNHGEKCVAHMTMTLSAKSAKALGLKKARIADLRIPLTTEADNEAANPRQPPCGCRPAPQGKLRLGLSASLKKKISRLSSLTMTMRVTYTVGSNAPETMKKVFKLARRPDHSLNGRLSNIPGFNDEGDDSEDMSNLDG